MEISVWMLNGVVVIGVLYTIAVELGSLYYVLSRQSPDTLVTRVQRRSRWWYRGLTVGTLALIGWLLWQDGGAEFLVPLAALCVGFFFYSVSSQLCIVNDAGFGNVVPGGGMEFTWDAIVDFAWEQDTIVVRRAGGLRREVRLTFRDGQKIPDLREAFQAHLDGVSKVAHSQMER